MVDGSTSTAAPAVAPEAPVRRRRGGMRLTALLLLAPTAVAVCRVADVDGVTPLPQLLAFLPWMLLPAGAALLSALLTRRRTGAVWAVAVLAVLGWFARPYDTGLAAEPSGPVTARVEVLTSNVEFGNGTPALLETIRRERPDLVFVQECPARCSDALASEVSRDDYPHREAVEGEMASGSAILSRFPLRPAAGPDSALAMPAAVAEIAGQQVRLQLAHPLPPVPGLVDEWREELGMLRTEAARGKESPAIVAGDFNATQDHAAFRRILNAGDLHDSAALAGAARTPSWPASVSRPLGAQIDHVLISPDFSVDSARFLDLPGTDHRSLLVRLDLHETR